MQYAYAVFELLAGLGAFLIGVKLLSDNMEKLATTKMRNLFHRASGKAVLPEEQPKRTSSAQRQRSGQEIWRASA